MHLYDGRPYSDSYAQRLTLNERWPEVGFGEVTQFVGPRPQFGQMTSYTEVVLRLSRASLVSFPIPRPKGHDCNEIVMMDGSEPVKSNTPWTKPSSL